VDERVIAGGREIEPRPGAGRRRPGAVAAAVLAALAAVTLARTPTDGRSEIEEIPDALAAAEAVPATQAPSLSESIAGWQWVIAVATSTAVVAWDPDASSPRFVRAPPGTLTGDFSGEWLSILTGAPQRALFVGSPTDMGVLADQVTGAVWHPFDPGRLAWVESSEGRTVLVVADLDASESDRTELAEVPEGAVPVWWNGAGVTLQVGGAVLVVDPEGRTTFADDGRLDPGGPTWAVIERAGALLVVNPLLRQMGPAPWEAECGPPATEPWSGSLAAVVCPVDGGGGELQVWRFTGIAATQLAVRRGFDLGVRPTWTPGGRFVLAVARDGTTVLVIDLTSQEIHRLDIGGRITGLAVAR
jgi:hypothetical protein